MAFVMSGDTGSGGYNYMRNLIDAISTYGGGRITPVMIFGDDVSADYTAPFQAIPGVEMVRHAAFDRARTQHRLRQALITGLDRSARDLFKAKAIDIVFETAQFFGWRLRIPTLAWIPDFQHRHIRSAFSKSAFWRREIGFQAQVLTGRHIMLSSQDARADCEQFYPATRGRTSVVRFAVASENQADPVADRAIADSYGLPARFFYLPNQFWSHKNHRCVVEALRIAGDRGRGDIVVVASGKENDPRSPNHFAELKAQIEAYGLGSNFRLLGLIPYAHVGALARTCEALINPSKFEGWSTTVEEGKASGAVMILSSLRVHREQADGRAQFFDPDQPEALADLLEASRPRSVAERVAAAAAGAEQALSDRAVFAKEFVATAGRVMEGVGR